MLTDITLKITPRMVTDAQGNEKKTLVGHIGTHFDVMNKEFPLEYTTRNGIIFDVSHVQDKDITIKDIDIEKVKKDMFVGFYSGFIDKNEYGSKKYFTTHPQLSNELIDELLSKKVSIIGVDFAGIRRGKEHTPKDQYCADHGVFIIENLCNLNSIANLQSPYIVHTYPMNYVGVTGLPCRVIVEY